MREPMSASDSTVRPCTATLFSWRSRSSLFQVSLIAPLRASVLSGAPRPASPSAGSSSSPGLTCHADQLPSILTGRLRAWGFSSSMCTRPNSTSGDSDQAKRPGSSGVTAPPSPGAPPTKAEPRHSVPCASPRVKRPPVCFSTMGPSQAAGRNTKIVASTASTTSAPQASARFMEPARCPGATSG
ncbi:MULTISPECIES: hypothetical protein [unclassified Massilia]|uniref:hypothetical protein n=1 Tax=unclassified Massilia TaxID=2609279 RepID=UPI001B81873B|nr:MULTISPECIES: hypothetical protein [unclassified Massilia]MBQ5940955.1 hypothetical protein [Massilia sp. AB1]MBQ5964374.1 hypothetical protein [Massilia sp. ZL223]